MSVAQPKTLEELTPMEWVLLEGVCAGMCMCTDNSDVQIMLCATVIRRFLKHGTLLINGECVGDVLPSPSFKSFVGLLILREM